VEAARARRANLAAEEETLAEEAAGLREYRDQTQASLQALRDACAALESEAREFASERGAIEAANRTAAEHLTEQRAAAVRLEAEAATLTEQAQKAQAAHDTARERLGKVQRQAAQLEKDQLRTLVQIKTDEEKARLAQEPVEKWGTAKPSGKPARWGKLGAGLAFAAVAGAIYLVPRYWPERAAPTLPVTAQAPQPGHAPATPSGSKPLYEDDLAARRDLNLSYELRGTATPAAAGRSASDAGTAAAQP